MGQYDDIIHLSRPVSKRHPPMPMVDRAAQFAPFAALTGYEDAIEEAARRTDAQIELGEDERRALDARLRILADRAAEHPRLRVTYFEPDDRKAGGAYVTRTGELKRLRQGGQVIEWMDGGSTALSCVRNIESSLFDDLEL